MVCETFVSDFKKTRFGLHIKNKIIKYLGLIPFSFDIEKLFVKGQWQT